MKVGVITFHNSYNCGSMLESYAIHKYLKNKGVENEIINFSNSGQRQLYSILSKNNSIKNIVKNMVLIRHYKRLKNNNNKYEDFKRKNFTLSKEYYDSKELNDSKYSVVTAGSDQIWNITIKDADDAYFLNWVNNARKVAYAPSFGARKISNYSQNKQKYIDYLKDFDAISIRENNGQKWIKEMLGIDVPVLVDPTLLLDSKEYDRIVDDEFDIPFDKYIFFYCPKFNTEICKFVKKVSKKYKLPVIAWSARSYYLKGVSRYGFYLPKYESPAVYLKLIKNAQMIFTTSFHGTIFSTIYKKRFFTIKNGEMFGDDDRVLTLLQSLNMMERLIPFEFKEETDYMSEVNYSGYDDKVKELREKAESFIEKNIVDFYNANNK